MCVQSQHTASFCGVKPPPLYHPLCFRGFALCCPAMCVCESVCLMCTCVHILDLSAAETCPGSDSADGGAPFFGRVCLPKEGQVCVRVFAHADDYVVSILSDHNTNLPVKKHGE